MSDQSQDELLEQVRKMLNAAEVRTQRDSSAHESDRARAVLVRVMGRIDDVKDPARRIWRPNWGFARAPRRRVFATLSVAIAVILLAGLVVSIEGGNGRLNSPITTTWQSGRSLRAKHGGATEPIRHGTWLLSDDSLSGTWQQIPVGPPGTGVTCPTDSDCYEMDTITTSPTENAPLVSVSFYASTDDGVSWTQYTMPSGFSPTTRLSCAAAGDCDAGGSYNGQFVLVSTTNGGHLFNVAPLPSSVGDSAFAFVHHRPILRRVGVCERSTNEY